MMVHTIAQARSFVARWYSIPLLLLVWQLAVGTGLVESRLLPSPVRVWDALVTDLGDGTLAYHAGVTLYRALTGFVLAAVIGVSSAHASGPTGWDGTNPFVCTLQQLGGGTDFPQPDADPFCVEYDKRHQNVTQLGVVQFLSLEPARVAAAGPKCFYFQRDHWVGYVVQGDPNIVVVITEMIGDSVGLGYYITIWSTRFTFANVYAAIIVIGICGLVLDQALLLLRHRAIYWQREAA